MSRRNLDQERWEIYLMQILLATRPVTFIGGVVLLVYAFVMIFVYPAVGGLAMGLSLLMFMLVNSDRAALVLARFGAWLLTRRIRR